MFALTLTISLKLQPVAERMRICYFRSKTSVFTSCFDWCCLWQGYAQDLLNRDRDETETFKILSEMRHCSFRDAGWDLEAPETLKSRELQRLTEMFSMTFGETHWQWKKLYGLMTSHHGKCFLFVMLWIFALYFDNYHWIINSLHHKELQLQYCRHEPLCLGLSQFSSNWN